MTEHGNIESVATVSRGGSRREQAVTAAFVSIANSLVEGYDIVELYDALTTNCASVLHIGAAGLLLADQAGVLQVVAVSSPDHNLELFMLQNREGPCFDCFASGVAVSVDDLEQAAGRWPRFAPAALAAGIASVHALPMHLRGTVLGTLGLFGTRPGALSRDDLVLAQALAHVASVALVADRAAADRKLVTEQLQTALDSRVVLEQAKGILAQLGDLDVPTAFAVLRRYARDHNRMLREVAEAVVDRTLLAGTLIDHGRATGIIGATRT